MRRAKVEFSVGSINHPVGIAEIPIVVEDEAIQFHKIRIVVVEADDRRANFEIFISKIFCRNLNSIRSPAIINFTIFTNTTSILFISDRRVK